MLFKPSIFVILFDLTYCKVDEQELSTDKLKPYKTDLEYLDDHFQVSCVTSCP